MLADAVSPRPLNLNGAADKTLRTAGVLWFVAAVLGQWAFVYYVASFYGGAALDGDFERWNDILVGGWVSGATLGNIVLAAHLLLAIVITVGGPLQLVPQLRRNVLPFHRWNGRIYVLTAIVISAAGAYAALTRGTAGGPFMVAGILLNGLLIMVFATLVLRHAMARNIEIHRRWAMRLFVVVSGVWFFRVGLMFWVIVAQGPVGFGDNFDGPIPNTLGFACYLLPLAVLELYLRAQDSAAAVAKFAMSGLLVFLTLAMALGIFGTINFMWLPRLSAA
jgi:hypothetical protein